MLTAMAYDAKRVRARAKILARSDRRMRAELIELRRNAGMTQQDVADLLGISQQAVQKLEAYDADPKLSTLRRYANAVGAIVTHYVESDRGQSDSYAASDAWPSQGRAATSNWSTAATAPPCPYSASYRDWGDSIMHMDLVAQ